ncbi:peroxidase family protein [Merismopedia glauca]|uniref:Heme peroxidase n=1 Tax=Merismopedia glauca CCAP 1448/3 TaxID=1296344 RepID=A0A2T1C3T9_9CYAN|nr:peroxidase family protein [Merismopedia glauca]PSB02942.1 heme peroxidase [Merismopedia glauca CCAP 1448/3]
MIGESDNRRDKSRDGWKNTLSSFLLTNFDGFWNWIQSVDKLNRLVNRKLINLAIAYMPFRPHPASTMHEGKYRSWESLTDKTYSGLHLLPRTSPQTTPPIAKLSELFIREGEEIPSPKSTVLFSYVAQWFTDGFLRTRIDAPNRLRNTSNHDIELCQLYGLRPETAHLLREKQGGRLKSQTINSEEYAPRLYEDDGTVKAEFKDIAWLPELEEITQRIELEPAKKVNLLAMGVERANVQLGYLMIGNLLLREHNRIARLLEQKYDKWDDERLFQTTRNIMTALLIKLVINEYINHIAPYNFKFSCDPLAFKGTEKWNRPNWMSLEFALLYRWHTQVPNNYVICGKAIPASEALWNPDLLINHNFGELFESASLQRSGKVCLHNTPAFLTGFRQLDNGKIIRVGVDEKSIELGRKANLQSYNDYRELCKFPRVTDFDQITGSPNIQTALEKLYGHVDNIDFYVGLFAEDLRPKSTLPPLMGRMVGVDAFSQLMTNPLFSPNIYNAETFSALGWEIIHNTNSLSELLQRNLNHPPKVYKATLNFED